MRCVFLLVCLSFLDFWVCKPEAAHIIQKYANQMKIICLCEASENVGLTVYYFEATMTSLEYIPTTEATINDVIHQVFVSAIITVPEGVDTTVMNEHFQKLPESCLQTSDNDTIMMIRKANHLLLFGLRHSVKRIITEHEKLKSKLLITQIELNLQDYQVCLKTNIAFFERFK